MISQAHFRTMMASDHLDDFLASSQALHLGDIQTFAQSYPPMHARRTPALIRQGDPEVFQLWLTVRGEVGLSQSGRHVDVGEGDLVLYDSSRPCQAQTAARDRPDVSSLIVQIPRARLPLHSNTLDQLTLTRIQGQTGIGALFRHYLTDLMNHAPQYEECDALRLANVTLDLLSAMLAEAARAEDLLPPESQQTVLRTRINAFIRQHLGDPGLTPAAVAAAHQVSVRYLHRLYQGQGTTIADGIRRSRLERIHRDLADPRLDARSISAIAARWGFPEPTSFSRAFKTLYGITPRAHRHQTQHPDMPAVR
ncbi:helix-turn-helix domain-containing protein [Streptomyces sp. NBC_01314]|uniref:AraC-like ligand-binding domain-containing protein n=1 Tax=Streptomyces sp. NBC_01314 TaxID=2903821 RepID=UPI00308A6E26|nr:helix-turn-helix domain-containing protein [Streptomyces sp. NBC_01314]